MSIEQQPPFEKPYIGPIFDKLERRSERYGRWSKQHIRTFLGALGISVTSTAGVPLALLLQGRGQWDVFLAFAVGIAATSSIGVLGPMIDKYVRARATERITPEEQKLLKAEINRFLNPPEKPKASFATEKPNPPPLPPSSASVPSPIGPRPGGLSATAEKEAEREPVLIK